MNIYVHKSEGGGGGVTFNKEAEERCPRTPPLTLTAITKPPAIKDKRKLKEVEDMPQHGSGKEKPSTLICHYIEIKCRDIHQNSAQPSSDMS